MQKVVRIKYFKGFNWYGFFTLYLKEVKRFFSVFAQTILAPAITTLRNKRHHECPDCVQE